MSEEQPVIRIEEGLIRGEKLKSVRGGVHYYSFKGIPYAEPPAGDLRFQPSVPVKNWSGIRDALKHGLQAPAIDMITEEPIPDTDEDCLYINVYTPKINVEKPKAVMVWIHGGGFMMGSGNSHIYGPDYLITEDIVLVTFNYRVGVLGFLSLKTTACPGNNGLKDMVLALKWVKRNIAVFGGDPDNVTIFGESAGGSAVQYLMMSKMAKGLFHKAISQSGTALDPWAMSQEPREFAYALGRELGLDAKSDEELLEFLKKAPANDLEYKKMNLPKIVKPDYVFLDLIFLPVVEPEHEGAFLTKHPKDIYQIGELHDAPYLLGSNTLEGIIAFYPKKDYKESVEDEELEKIILYSNLNIEKGSKKSRIITQKIRDYYFPNGYDERKLVDLHSVIYFLDGINKSCEYLTRRKFRLSPTYLYEFTFDGNKAFLKHDLGYGKWKGTCHADDLGYLFHISMIKAQLIPNTREYTAVESITKLWTNFAKTGNPTPESLSWEPISHNNFQYLDIGDDLTMKKNYGIKSAFWDELEKIALSDI